MKGIRWYVKSTINIHKWWRTKDTQLTSFPKFGSWFFHQSTLNLRHRMCLLRGRQANVLHNAALLAQLDSPGDFHQSQISFFQRLVVMRIWKKQDHGIFFLYVSLRTAFHGFKVWLGLDSVCKFISSRFQFPPVTQVSQSSARRVSKP